MEKSKIIQFYHPVLRKKAKEIEKGKETDCLVEKMKKILKDSGGVGLAAPQIGVSKKIILVAASEEHLMVFLNSSIVEKGEERVVVKEGCLSLKGVWLDVERAKKVTVEFQTQKGERKKLKAEGMLAVILQHEIDHLDGKLFIDKASFFTKIKLLLSYYFQKYVKSS